MGGWVSEDVSSGGQRIFGSLLGGLSAKASGPSSVQSVQPVGPGTPVVLISLWL